MLLDIGKGGWLNSAKQHPDKIKQFIEKLSLMVEIAIQVNSRSRRI
jgi:hypothetical protein